LTGEGVREAFAGFEMLELSTTYGIARDTDAKGARRGELVIGNFRLGDG